MDLFNFFFVKQKTAYEMRISDWSSDVCSSDLDVVARGDAGRDLDPRQGASGSGQPRLVHGDRARAARQSAARARGDPRDARRLSGREDAQPPRSEEHTSELQSLMRISYAVFCLKKKKKDRNIVHTKVTIDNI